MKILHIINNLGSGGAEKLIEETLPLFNKKEDVYAEVLLITDKNNVFDKSLQEKGIKISVIPIRKLKSPMNIFYIRRFIIKGDYDIVHGHLFPTLYWVSLASKIIFRNRPKFIYTEHSTNNRRRKKYFLKHLEKYIYSEFNNIISISRDTQYNLIEWLKPREKNLDKFKIVNNGVDINKFKNAIPYKKNEINERFNKKTKLLCMVSRFSEAKDQPTLIKAMKELSKDIHLLFVGEGPLKEQNKKLASDIGVLERVHFLGFRDDVDRILKTCDIIILSSHWEGLSIASIEAMASEKPFIASRVIGLEEVVDGYGLLFHEGDVVQLNKLIKKLFENKSFYKKISDRCIKRVEDFDIHEMILQYLNIYKSVKYSKKHDKKI